MLDPYKFFDTIKNMSDQSVEECLKLFNEPHDPQAMCAAGLRTTQPTSQGFGFTSNVSAPPSETELRETSLFSYAVINKKYNFAKALFIKFQLPMLLKANEKKENGFHAVAKCPDDQFRGWFLLESPLAGMSQFADQIKSAINQLTSSDQHLLTIPAVSSVYLNEYQLWINYGADPSLPGNKTGNLLHHLADKTRSDLVGYFVEQHPELISGRNDKGQVPAHSAAAADNIEMLQILTRAGYSLSAEDKSFNRPLHLALTKGAVRAIEWILSNEPNVLVSGRLQSHVNQYNSDQDTPLHLLVFWSRAYTDDKFTHALDLLFAYGADTTLQNMDAQTPLKLARNLNKQNGISSQFFDKLWGKVVEKFNPQVFTRDTLFQKITQHYPPPHAQQLITALSPIFNSQASDPFAIIQQNYIQSLKEQVKKKYESQPQIVQSFSLILDEVVKIHAEFNQRPQTASMLSFQWQQRAPIPSKPSETHLSNQYMQFS